MAVLSSHRPLLEVHDLGVGYGGNLGSALAGDGLSFDPQPGEIVGVEGRSECGKTTTALAILKILPPDARVSGSVVFAGRNLLSSRESEMRQIRGSKISIIYEEPILALNGGQARA